MTPRIISPWTTIAPAPDLTPHGLQPTHGEPGLEINHPNDHTLFQDDAGHWHLWACVRHTRVGRVLAHWSSPKLLQAPWKLEPDVIRCDRTAGESRVEWRDQEFLQSPFVVQHAGQWWMIYGGYDTGFDRHGQPTDDYNRQEKQLCLMTSPNGREWTRHHNTEGLSRLFWGPGAVRDPMVGHFGGRWIAYYSGHHDQDRNRAGIYARESDDLLTWSDWHLVHFDERPGPSGKPFHPESPFVVQRQGRYYLFRTHGHVRGCQVFVSDDPLSFGLNAQECEARRVAHLPAIIAPEILQLPDGRQYITTITDGQRYGIRIAELRWE